MTKSDFKKKLAEEVHAGWRGFISYILGKADYLPDGSIKIKKAQVDRWKRMADSTHYKLRMNEKIWADTVVERIMHIMTTAKKKAIKPKADPRVKEVKDIFIKYCENIRGFTPEINHAIDGSIIKKRLEIYSVEDLTDCFDWFMNTEDYSKFSCSIKTVLSIGIFNKWLEIRD